MTIVVFLIGEYDTNTELYINNLLTPLTEGERVKGFRCTFFNEISEYKPENIFLLDPCPEEIITCTMDKMNDWAYQECFHACWRLANKQYQYDCIIVMPYGTVFDNKHFIHKYKTPGTMPINIVKSLSTVMHPITNDRIMFVPEGIEFPNIQSFRKIKIPSYTLQTTTLRNELLYDNVFACKHVPDWKNHKNIKCICIPSIIHVRDPSRSVFTSTERLDQTVRQIKSIRKYVKDAKIVLLEMSCLTPKEMNCLAHITDIIWTFDQDPQLQQLAYGDPNKNKAEVYVLREFWSRIDKTFDITHFAKFGGRYWLTRDVDDILFKTKPVMKRVFADSYQQLIIEPVFYSIPAIEVLNGRIINVFDEMLKVMDIHFTDNERLLYDLYAKNESIHSPDVLYIQGYTATSGVFRFY